MNVFHYVLLGLLFLAFVSSAKEYRKEKNTTKIAVAILVYSFLNAMVILSYLHGRN
jgi:hypothetical protein